MAAKAAAQEEQPDGAPEWIVTFTDLISLLVTFFVLLMTFSSFDESNHNIMAIKGLDLMHRRAVVENRQGHSAVDPPEQDLLSAVDPVRGAENPHSRPQRELLENLLEMGQKPAEGYQEVDLSAVSDGLRIAFEDSCCFAPGSDEVGAPLRRKLLELGRTLGAYENLVLVEGFTDSQFQPTPAHPTAEALGLARAAAAARVLLECPELDERQVQVAGLGESPARADNDSALSRARNRRVEVRVLGLSRARAESLARERESGEGAPPGPR